MQHLTSDELALVAGGASSASQEIKTALTSVQSAVKDLAYTNKSGSSSSTTTMMMMAMMMRRR
jgi:hypothetical protein